MIFACKMHKHDDFHDVSVMALWKFEVEGKMHWFDKMHFIGWKVCIYVTMCTM